MICWLPGLTVRCVSRVASPLTVIVTWVLWPAASVPEAGATFSSPSRLDGSVIDQETGPFSAVSVIVPPADKVSTTVEGETLSVPWPAGADDAPGEGVGDDAEDGDGAAVGCAVAGFEGADGTLEPVTVFDGTAGVVAAVALALSWASGADPDGGGAPCVETTVRSISLPPAGW